jgi:hypothetical protein
MATIEDSGFPNLANVASRLDPDGSAAMVANVLSEKNPILDDIPFVEGNLQTGHRITQAANALPSASWRLLNQGIAATKAYTQQFDESCGILEDESKIDERVAELNGGAEYRDSEDMLKLEGMAQQFATSVFYESTSSNPERIHGLSPRYSATSGITAADYVSIGTNADSDCHSIWLITWAPRKLYGIYPKGTKAGLERNDKGLQRVQDDATSLNSLWAWITQFVWRVGIAVEDYRYACRFQWDPSDSAMGDTNFGIVLNMIDMLNQIFEPDGAMFYMNRTSKTQLDQQLANADGNYLTYESKGGRLLPHFLGVPIRVTDALVAETAVS